MKNEIIRGICKRKIINSTFVTMQKTKTSKRQAIFKDSHSKG